LVNPSPLPARPAVDVSIILPRHGEDSSVILETLRRLKDLENVLTTQIILVNDGGTTADVETARQKFPDIAVVSNREKSGKGISIKRGLSRAVGRYVFYTDVDLPVDPDQIVDAVNILDNHPGPAMVIGNRMRDSAPDAPSANAYRRLTSRAYLWLFNAMLQPDIRDSQCPFKLMERSLCERLFPMSFIRGYAFDAELIHLALLSNVSVHQLDIRWADTRASWGLAKTAFVFITMVVNLFSIKLYSRAIGPPRPVERPPPTTGASLEIMAENPLQD
jgi:dolichyl-phosphate beta-glucosyltransferase